MKLKPNSTISIFIVLIVAIGLVMTYVPLFSRPRIAPPPVQENSVPQDVTVSAPTSSNNQNQTTSVPSGFGGLEEESKSLDGLLGK